MHNDGEWEVLDEQLGLLAATYGRGQARTVALRLRDGGLVVWSPGSRADVARSALAKWGKPRFLLAPNHFHNLGLDEWKAAYPEARVVAHPTAHARLKKRIAAARDVADFGALQRELPEGVRLISPPTAKQGETWLSVNRGELRALAVCDAITNMEEVTWAFRVLGFRAELMTNPMFKRLFLTNKPHYREWASTEIASVGPNVFIPAHGRIARGAEIAAELQRVTQIA